jgi:hypothetical protein
MSNYYNIEGLKIRVSNHEPNYSMSKFRGENDIEFYTKNIEGEILSVADQIECYCNNNDIDISLFAKIIEDFSSENIPQFKVVSNKEELSYIIYFSNGNIFKALDLSEEEFEECENMTENDWKKSNTSFEIIK